MDGVGDLPVGWEPGSLSHVSSYIRGVTYKKAESSNEPVGGFAPLLRATNISDGRLVLKDFVFVHESLVKDEQRLRPGDLVIAASSGSSSVVGKSAPITESFDGTFGAFCAVLRPGTGIAPAYLHLFAASPAVRERWTAAARGSNINNLKRDDILATAIPLPPLPEQHRIVEILEEQLSRIDAALESVRLVREKAAQFRRSLLHAAFTGALTGEEIGEDGLPVGWTKAALGEVADIVSGSTPKTSVEDHWGGHIQWLTPDDLSSNKSKVVDGGKRTLTQKGYDSCSTRLVPKGTVLFTSRAPIGYVAIAGGEICTNQGFKSVVPGPNLTSDYLYWHLQERTPDIRSRASGTTFLEISGKRMGATVVVLPPLPEQHRIVEILEEQLSRIDASLTAADTIEQRAAALRRSLLHAAFTGRLTEQWRQEHAHV